MRAPSGTQNILAEVKDKKRLDTGPTTCTGNWGVGSTAPGEDGAPAVLDSFSHFSHMSKQLVHISRVVGRYRYDD
jgi:hypothetical protein